MAQKDNELKKYGLSHIGDIKVSERIYILNQIHEVLENKSIHVDVKIDYVNRAIHIVAAPWGRGGTNGVYALLTMYWEIIMREWNDYLTLRVRDRGASIFSQQEMNNLIDRLAWRDVIPFGWMIINVAWQEMDVSPQTVAIIQSIMPMGAQQVTPTSHMPPPQKPGERTYKDKLSADLDGNISQRIEEAAESEGQE